MHPYQKVAHDFVADRIFHDDQLGASLLMSPGLGKSLVTLHLLDYRRLYCDKPVLIIAPIPVVFSVWKQEAKKWGFDFKISIVHGAPDRRVDALKVKADIYLVNPDGLPWLAQQTGLPDWSTLIVDESSEFKSWSARRTKALRKLLPNFNRRLILTGSPTPNCLSDYYAQQFIIDDGLALGAGVMKFRKRFMRVGGFENREWIFRRDMIDEFAAAVRPGSLHQSAEGNLTMPAAIRQEVKVDMPDEAHATYKRMERQMFARGDDIRMLAKSGGHKYLLCRQLANGGAYGHGANGREVHQSHMAKVEALVNLRERVTGQLIVGYQFKHDLDRIRMVYPKIEAINGDFKARNLPALIERWRAGDVGTLAVQSQALSYGVDGFQDACNDLCWFGLTDNAATHKQLNARVYRQGVKGDVRFWYLLARGTVDSKIMRLISEKTEMQDSFMGRLKRP